jgi:CubicO group peptidase (beta-lactamase class C family)
MQKFKRQLSYAFCFIILPCFIFSKNLSEELNLFLSDSEKNWNFSGSVLVSKKDKIILRQGYGKANFEHDVENSSDTIFRISSLSKLITATAILSLQEKGLIDLDKSIVAYLPYYPKKTGKKITIHHLLTHSSGIPDYTKFADYEKFQRQNLSTQKLISSFRNRTLEFRPGTKSEYSNSNYVLLGAIIEAITNTTYDKYLEKQIFSPLNMVSSGYDKQHIAIPKKAMGYSYDNKEHLINASFIDMTTSYSSAGLYSSIEDLFLFDRALQNQKILSIDSLKAFFTPHVGNFGYGWSIVKKFGKKMAYQTGKINGFHSTYVKFLNDDVTIIILSNNEKNPTETIADSLAAIIFSEPYENPVVRNEADVKTNIYKNYIGKYFHGNKKEMEIYTYNDRLFLLLDKKKKIELLPTSSEGKEFFCKSILDLKVTFNNDSFGDINYLSIYEKNQKFFFKKHKENDEIAFDEKKLSLY